MSGHNCADLRQSFIQLQPAAIKQLDDLIAVHPGHTRCRRVSQHALDLRMLQDLIASGSRDKIHACLQKLSNRYRVAILPIATNQSNLWSESKELQVEGNGSGCWAERT